MVRLRAAKIAGIANDIPDVEVEGDADDAELLVLGWGSTWGAIDGGMNRVRARGHKIAHAHLRHLNPFPRNLAGVLQRYPKVLVPEMNLGQLSRLVRAEFLVDARSVSKVQGTPFTAGELENAILDELGVTAE
jgi:2-oxoglutarate ferredoxin oxidoreductase subunit alpha